MWGKTQRCRRRQRWNGEQGFGFVLSQSLAPLLYLPSMERGFSGGIGLAGTAGSDRALLALGVGFGLSHTRSRTGDQTSFVRVKTQQHLTFHDKDNSFLVETYFSMYFSWLLTKTKSCGCTTIKDCLMSYLIKFYFYCFLCFPSQ